MAGPLLVVLVHCNEHLLPVLKQLRAVNLPYKVYHKTSRRCHAIRSKDVEPGELINMPHNLGRECSGYLRFIVDHYEASLPRMTVFLQAGAEMHLPFTRGIWHSIRPLVNITEGYVGLSKTAFEGRWPSPCEPARHRAAFAACHASYWRDASGLTRADGPEAGQPVPQTVRFYANGLFAASAARIRRRPRALYQTLLDRLEGREPLLCVNPREPRQAAFAPWVNESDRIAPSEIDCLMLEKLWHVLLGEPARMPPPSEYDAGKGRYSVEDVQWSTSHGARHRAGLIQCTEHGT